MGIRIKSTQQHKDYWANRKIDWNQSYLSTWNHPHRQLIVAALKSIGWTSLWEVGCACGPNLVKITKEFQGKQLGGSDVNPDAIALAEETFKGARFHVESAEDLLLSDKSVDVVLSDASLIYIGPQKIHKVMNELTRISRNHILLCELHCTSWWKRFMYRIKTGYNMYDYEKLLKEYGCYNVQIVKIPKEYWPGTPWEEHGYIILANVIK